MYGSVISLTLPMINKLRITLLKWLYIIDDFERVNAVATLVQKNFPFQFLNTTQTLKQKN